MRKICRDCSHHYNFHDEKGCWKESKPDEYGHKRQCNCKSFNPLKEDEPIPCWDYMDLQR